MENGSTEDSGEPPGMKRACCLALAAAAVVANPARSVPAPSLVTRAAAATEAAKTPYAFDIEVSSAGQAWKAHFEPKGSPRLRLVAPPSLQGDAKTSFSAMARGLDGVRWCASPELTRAQEMHRLREDDTSETYAFDASPEMMSGGQSGGHQNENAPLSIQPGQLQGEVTVTKQDPDVVQFRIYATRPISPMVMVRLEHLDFLVHCAVAPNGRRYAGEISTGVSGTAFGRQIERRSVQHTTNLVAR